MSTNEGEEGLYPCPWSLTTPHRPGMQGPLRTEGGGLIAWVGTSGTPDRPYYFWHSYVRKEGDRSFRHHPERKENAMVKRFLVVLVSAAMLAALGGGISHAANGNG